MMIALHRVQIFVQCQKKTQKRVQLNVYPHVIKLNVDQIQPDYNQHVLHPLVKRVFQKITFVQTNVSKNLTLIIKEQISTHVAKRIQIAAEFKQRQLAQLTEISNVSRTMDPYVMKMLGAHRIFAIQLFSLLILNAQLKPQIVKILQNLGFQHSI
ncbi:Hypothetical_protein [Hexamita inflata]|uniref:Hypothetical_protein n=1 Tax=Hexamita inflata TaxID=28002 RepID=A0AA86N882_9EUKA|nr:Hypothetical protein HINF_LOCUS2181 [Hexamita inflata]